MTPDSIGTTVRAVAKAVIDRKIFGKISSDASKLFIHQAT
jgi:hypothetical protein